MCVFNGGEGWLTFVEFLQPRELWREAAFTRCVDYEDDFAFVGVEGDFVAFFVFGLEGVEVVGHACEVSAESDGGWSGGWLQEASCCASEVCRVECMEAHSMKGRTQKLCWVVHALTKECDGGVICACLVH